MNTLKKYLKIVSSKIFWSQVRQALVLFATDNVWGMIRLGSQGRDVTIRPSAILANSHNIFLGDFVEIQRHVYLMAGKTAKIKIGDNSMIGPGVFITAGNHGFAKSDLIRTQPGIEADVVIGEDVFIGAYAIILPGVTIGAGAIIGAGTVVRRNVAADAIIAVPHSKTFGKRL